MSRKRLLLIAVLTVTLLAGCSSGGPMSVTDTRLAHEDNRVGVYAELSDTSPNDAGPVTVHAELLDADENMISERDEEFEVGGRDTANVVVWFDGLSESERGQVEGARASVAE